jgi:ketosteroid isomerase-like protein
LTLTLTRRRVLAGRDSDVQPGDADVTARENVQLARRAFQAFAKRDVDAVLRVMDENVEFFATTGELSGEEGSHWERGAYWGRKGVRRYLQDVGRLWVDLEVIAQEYRELDDRVLVLGQVRGTTRDGVAIDSPAQWIWKIRGGKIIYWAEYSDEGEALEAVGLADGGRE